MSTREIRDNDTKNQVKLSLDRSGRGGYQVSIGNNRHGYRLMGPKYLGDSTNIREVVLDERDAREIRAYLNEAFPETADDLRERLAALEADAPVVIVEHHQI